METSPPEFSLLYDDTALLIVNKPTRLLSVPGRGEEKQDCLIRRVQTRYPDALIVHRLDFDTSGLIVLARGKQMHRCLSILFRFDYFGLYTLNHVQRGTILSLAFHPDRE